MRNAKKLENFYDTSSNPLRFAVGSKSWSAAGANKNIYLRLTVEKMRAFVVFTDKYLRLYGCSGTHFKAVVNWANPITEI